MTVRMTTAGGLSKTRPQPAHNYAVNNCGRTCRDHKTRFVLLMSAGLLLAR
jgi:hypothetical protein